MFPNSSLDIDDVVLLAPIATNFAILPVCEVVPDAVAILLYAIIYYLCINIYYFLRMYQGGTYDLDDGLSDRFLGNSVSVSTLG